MTLINLYFYKFTYNSNLEYANKYSIKKIINKRKQNKPEDIRIVSMPQQLNPLAPSVTILRARCRCVAVRVSWPYESVDEKSLS